MYQTFSSGYGESNDGPKQPVLAPNIDTRASLEAGSPLASMSPCPEASNVIAPSSFEAQYRSSVAVALVASIKTFHLKSCRGVVSSQSLCLLIQP